jgi:hypothetical protein
LTGNAPSSKQDEHTVRERSAAERFNSNLKDNYGGRFVLVRGPEKVMCHLMFGVLALTIEQLMRLVT